MGILNFFAMVSFFLKKLVINTIIVIGKSKIEIMPIFLSQYLGLFKII